MPWEPEVRECGSSSEDYSMMAAKQQWQPVAPAAQKHPKHRLTGAIWFVTVESCWVILMRLGWIGLHPHSILFGLLSRWVTGTRPSLLDNSGQPALELSDRLLQGQSLVLCLWAHLCLCCCVGSTRERTAGGTGTPKPFWAATCLLFVTSLKHSLVLPLKCLTREFFSNQYCSFSMCTLQLNYYLFSFLSLPSAWLHGACWCTMLVPAISLTTTLSGLHRVMLVDNPCPWCCSHPAHSSHLQGERIKKRIFLSTFLFRFWKLRKLRKEKKKLQEGGIEWRPKGTAWRWKVSTLSAATTSRNCRDEESVHFHIQGIISQCYY